MNFLHRGKMGAAPDDRLSARKSFFDLIADMAFGAIHRERRQ
jgi:hypothetical protein